MTESCETCRFYRRKECHHSPPHLHSALSTAMQFPGVRPDDWCGEYQSDGWVSVKERKPPGGYVLAFSPGFHSAEAGMGVFADHEMDDATHWRPLPEPPL